MMYMDCFGEKKTERGKLRSESGGVDVPNHNLLTYLC